MSRLERQSLEERAIWLSVIGSLFMTLLGFGFALVSQSDAIALDGVFSLVGFAVALLTLKVSRLVRRPGNETHPFGFAAYEPMLNLAKGLLLAVVLVFAAIRAIMSVLEGGNPIVLGVALVYAVAATAGCAVIAILMKRAARKSQSPIVEVDVKSWIIDTLLSGGVAASFAGVMLLERLGADWLVPYADPAIVLILVLLAVMLPIQIIRVNWRQIIGTTPPAPVEKAIREIAEGALDEVDGSKLLLRAGQMGRLVYARIYVVVPLETSLSAARRDELRQAVLEGLSAKFSDLAFDMTFTSDAGWFDRSWGAEPADG